MSCVPVRPSTETADHGLQPLVHPRRDVRLTLPRRRRVGEAFPSRRHTLGARLSGRCVSNRLHHRIIGRSGADLAKKGRRLHRGSEGSNHRDRPPQTGGVARAQDCVAGTGNQSIEEWWTLSSRRPSGSDPYVSQSAAKLTVPLREPYACRSGVPERRSRHAVGKLRTARGQSSASKVRTILPSRIRNRARHGARLLSHRLGWSWCGLLVRFATPSLASPRLVVRAECGCNVAPTEPQGPRNSSS